MLDIPASEYINTLLAAYQYAEKIYSQAVSDVIAAEVRRDEAKKARDELFARLENARVKYASNKSSSPLTKDTSNIPPRGNNVMRNSNGAAGRRKQPPQYPSKKKVPNSDEAGERNMQGQPPKTPTRTEPKGESSPVTPTPTAISADDILLSPTAGTKKAPRIFSSPAASPRKRSSRFVTLAPLGDVKPVFDIAPGRTREWYEKHFDCESCGLVKNFYQAAFGTKTNEKTHKVTVRTVVLNDEWNELVADTGKIQDMYIGKSTDKGGRPNPRDKAAEALVNPPQKEPIAFFSAPKKSQDTSLVFYVGHWKVIDGKMLNPPRAVKGQPRQCLVKFSFVGVDRMILEALNKAPP